MSIIRLLQWQWNGYPKYHQARANLLIHIVAVPLFLIGTLALVGAMAKVSISPLGVAVSCIVVAVVLQGRGHRMEPFQPEPFSGPVNFIARLFLEQCVTFPRFVLSGKWLAALRKSPGP